jgi:hypothetical protein
MYDIYQSTADDACRFALGRSGRRTLVVVGLNPSTATREKSDPTAAKVERVARAYGYDGFVLVNLCPVRATDCHTLPTTVEPGLLEANLEAIGDVAASVQDLVLWAAWGAPILMRVVSEIDGRMFTIGDGSWTRLTAAPAPRCLAGAQNGGSSGNGS